MGRHFLCRYADRVWLAPHRRRLASIAPAQQNVAKQENLVGVSPHIFAGNKLHLCDLEFHEYARQIEEGSTLTGGPLGGENELEGNSGIECLIGR